VILADLVIFHARQIVCFGGDAPLRGSEQGAINLLKDGAIAASNGRIVYVGPSADVHQMVAPVPGARFINGRDVSIVPGFVDPHTHAAFAGDRREELRKRLAGATYGEIAAAGGGILSTVAATRAASDVDLIDQTRTRLDEMLACGTTTCEIKSGYGLSLESELKILRAVRKLADSHPIEIVTTFLGAHEVPLEFRGERSQYVDVLVTEMIPAVARERLAEWCDVFCETGVFTPAEAIRILEAGQGVGLRARIHADELGASGGSQVAAQVRARSADHLIFVPEDGIIALADAGVTATLLPIAAFYLKLGRFAPARDLITASVPVALATDVNPGGGFSPSMPFAMALACFAMNMTFEEALAAATINAAWSIGRAETVGSLAPGKQMDAVLVDGDAINLIRVGAPAIAAVLKRGECVAGSLPGTMESS
jgi:imidazolonepropionase